MSYPGPFLPYEIQSANGELWLIGTTPSGCGIERVDPATLHGQMFGLPECGFYVTAGPGRLYLVAAPSVKGAENQPLRIEAFDTTTGRANLRDAVMANTIGSGLAHLAFTYGDGSLWLYSWVDDKLLRVSPATGAVVGAISGFASNGGHAVLISVDSELWMAEGPGGPRLFRASATAQRAQTLYQGSTPGSLLWVAAAGRRIWADVATYSDNGRTVSTRLVAFDRGGRKLLETGPEDLGDAAVAGAGDNLWSVGWGQTCRGPQRLWRIDGATGRSTVVATLHPPISACVAGDGRRLDYVDGYVFVLDATRSASPAGVLYRVAP